MIDWCPSCAVAGSKLKHQDIKHQMFAYIFTRIAKDIEELKIVEYKEDQFYYNIDDQIFQKYFLDTPIVNLLYKKSYWKFMEHLMNETLGSNYKLEIKVNKNNYIQLKFYREK